MVICYLYFLTGSAKAHMSEDQSTKDILKGSFFGNDREGQANTQARGGSLPYGRKEGSMHNPRMARRLTFNDVAAEFSTGKKFMARYFTYKDWRDRGLVIKNAGQAHHKKAANPTSK